MPRAMRIWFLSLVGLILQPPVVAQPATAPAFDFSALSTKPGAAPRLKFWSPEAPAEITDICKKCVAPASGTTYPICTMILCKQPEMATVVEVPVIAPTGADSVISTCGRYASMSVWCGSLKPGTPGLEPAPQNITAYKRWLEAARIGADLKRQQGLLTREEYFDFLNAYRQDWKALSTK